MITELKFKGESTVAICLQLIIIVPLFGLILTSLFLSFSVLGKIIMILFILLGVLFFLKKGIKSVVLSTDNLVVNNFIGSLKIYSYSDFHCFEMQNQLAPHPELYIGNVDRKIIVVKFNNKRTDVKKTKIYFYCPSDKEKELKDFLATKNLKIT